MKRYAPTLFCLLLLSTAVPGQESNGAKPNGAASPATGTIAPAPAITPNSTPLELARAALAAQGGEKFKNLKSMMMTGTVDLYPPNSAQSIPGKFAMVT